MTSHIAKFPHIKSLFSYAIVQMFIVLAYGILDKPYGLYIGTFRSMIDRVIVRDSLGIAPNYTTTVSWSQALPGVVSSALALYNFEMVNSYVTLSYTAQLRFVNVSNALLQINPIGPNSSVNYLAFKVLIVTDPLAIWQIIHLEVQLNSLTMVTASSFKQVCYVYSSRYVFTGSACVGSPHCYVRYLQWFVLNSSNVHSQYLNLWSQFIVGTSAIRIDISTNYPDKYYKAKLFILLYSSNTLSNIAAYDYQIVLGDAHPISVFSVNMAVPVNIFGSPYFQNRCIFGFTGLAIYVNSALGSSRFQFDFNGTIITNAIFTPRIRTASLFTVCYASCPSGKYLQPPYACQNCTIQNCQQCTSSLCKKCKDNYLLSTILNSCIPCAHYISNCLSCSSNSVCTECSLGYILSFNNASCLSCSSFINSCYECVNSTYCTSCIVGFAVMGSCTTISGCLQTVQAAGSSFCLLCDASEYDPNPVNGVCVCKQQQASIVSGHCTTVSGCIATQKVGSIAYCMACNVIKHFYYEQSTHSCLCISGYSLEQGTCIDTCGDGIVFTSQCDDGNKENGDGCSSQCLVETNYRCTSNNTLQSSCQYLGKHVQISLTDTQKTKGQNQGIFTFIVEPAMALLNKYDLSLYFRFSCNDATYQVVSWSYSAGELILIVDYETDLEGRQALVNFTFNQLFIRLQPIIMQFTIKSSNVMLIIGDQSNKSIIIRYIFLSISAIGVILLVLGSWAHLMAGVQLVTSLQLIYYLHFTTLYYTPALSCFQELSLVGLNDLFLQVTEQNYNTHNNFQKVRFSMNKTEMTIAGVSVFLISTCIVLFVLFILGNLPKANPIFEKATSLSQQLYRSLLLPVCLWILIPEILASFAISTKSNSQSVFFSKTLKSLCSFIAYAICSLVFTFRFKDLFIGQKELTVLETRKRKSQQDNYIPLFQLYLFLQAFLLILWTRGGNIFFFYTIFFIQILMFVMCIKFRPYSKILDRVTLVLNLALVVAFLVFLTIRQNGIIAANQLNDIFCILLVGVLMCLCGLLTITRVFISIYEKIRRGCREEQENQKSVQGLKQISEKVGQKDQQKSIKKRETINNHLLKYIREGQTKNNALNNDQTKQKDTILQRLTNQMKNQFRKTRSKNKPLIKLLQ